MSQAVEQGGTIVMKAGCALGIWSCTYNFFAQNAEFITGVSGSIAIGMMLIPPATRLVKRLIK